jgi:tetratricopeptide (TPR) repeat protein
MPFCLKLRTPVAGAVPLVVLAAIFLAGCAPADRGSQSTTEPAVIVHGSSRPSLSPSPGSPSPSPSGVALAGPETSPTEQSIERLQAALAADPSREEAWLELGVALLQRVRETADPSLYPKADEALHRALTLDPRDPLALVGIGTLQLARHQFADALVSGHAALAIVPSLPTAIGVVVDALNELGRYDDALREAQRMVNTRPDLASFARVSYVRELRGDLKGALTAMEAALQAGGGAAENNAYIEIQVGNLLVLNGHRAEAREAYAQALELYPDFPAALAAQGRLAVGDGDLTTAIDRFRHAAAIVPLPEYVIALGEAQEAAGDSRGAQDSYALARAETTLFKANGVVVDLELALFEADHGDPATALQLARAAYTERPTIKAADALAWAEYKNGNVAEARRRSKEALRLGTLDPVLRYHAGVIAAAAHQVDEARNDLRRALALDPGWSATAAEAAKALLASLGT